MNIFFVNSTRKWGGVKSWMRDFGSELHVQGHHVHVAARPGPFARACAAKGLTVHTMRFGMDFSPLTILRFLRLYRRNRTEVVVVNVGKDMRTAGMAARLLGIPVVHRIGLPGDAHPGWKVRLAHAVVKPRYLTTCEYIREGMLKSLPFLSREQITVIANGKTPAPKPPTAVHTPLRLVTTSQLNPDKGHMDLIEALGRLKREGHRFVWNVLGEGSETERLKAAAAEAGLGNDIVWCGFTENVPAFLAECDVFVLPSHREGMPNSLLEAMSQGLIVVAYDVGGIPECWPEGMSRFLVAHDRRVSGLVEALSELFAATGLVHLKNAVYSHFLSRFLLSDNTRKLAAWMGEMTAC